MAAKIPRPWLRKDRGRWYVQIGKKQIPLGTDEKGAWEEYHRVMARRGQVPPETVRLTVHMLAEHFLDHVRKNRAEATYNWYQLFIQSFADRHGRLDARRVLPLHLTDWLDAQDGWGQSTRRGAITAVKRCWAWAKEEGRIEANPLATVRRPKQTRRAGLTDEDAAKLLATMPPGPLRDYVDGLILTGCRPGELARVEAATVDLRRGKMTVTGKAGTRDVILTAEAAALIGRKVAESPAGPLFRNTEGNAWTRNALRCAFALRKKKTGVAGTAYAFRHFFGTRAIERGVDSLLVAELMGHRDVRMLQEHYAHHRAETLRRAAEQATTGRPIDPAFGAGVPSVDRAPVDPLLASWVVCIPSPPEEHRMAGHRTIEHPPHAAGATTAERSVIDRLHRAATAEHGDAGRNEASPIMLEGVALIVDLIRQRGVGQAFVRHIDDQDEGAG